MKTSFALLLAGAVAGCQHHDEPSAAAAASVATDVVPTAAPTPSGPPRDTWYTGTWSGTYDARVHKLDLPTKQGGLAEWKLDDGKHATGAGKLTLVAVANGVANGSAEGPLGKVTVRGSFDGDVVALRFFPSAGDPEAFSGVIVAHRDGDHLTGTLEASTPDGHVARDGTVKLGRN